MVDNSAAFAVISAVIVALVSTAVWRYIGRLRQRVLRLEQEVAALRRDRATRPVPRVSFEFDPTTREALLHVTNDGGDAEVRAAMSIEGALATRLNGDVCAAWSETSDPTAVVRRGETKTLRLARLDLSVFPYAQWEIYMAPDNRNRGSEAGRIALRAMHTSTIGGDPETHAPAMFLQVALMTSPDATGPAPHCTVALQPFEAVRLRPL